MTKTELAFVIAEEVFQPVDQVSLIIDAFAAVVMDSVTEGETIYLRGFGSFGPVRRKAKKSQNLHTHTTIDVAECTIPKFKPSNLFKNHINQVKS